MKSLLVFVMLLTGCATVQRPEVFAACKAVDTATTLEIVHNGGHEMNPIMGSLVHFPVAFIAVEALLVMAVYHYQEKLSPAAKVAINAAGCIPAVHNLGQL